MRAGQSAADSLAIRVLLPTFPAPIGSCFLPTGCAVGISLATCRLSLAFFSTRRYFAGSACREWPLTSGHFSRLYFGFWPVCGTSFEALDAKE